MPTLATNTQARHEYRFLESFEAGLKLNGAEVKAAKAGQLNLRGSYIQLNAGQAKIHGLHISPYKPAAAHYPKYDPIRDRVLLAKKSEWINWSHKLDSIAGSTLLIDSIYTKGGLIKANVVLAVGKKKYDKRESIKRKEVKKRLRQVVYN